MTDFTSKCIIFCIFIGLHRCVTMHATLAAIVHDALRCAYALQTIAKDFEDF